MTNIRDVLKQYEKAREEKGKGDKGKGKDVTQKDNDSHPKG